MSVLFSNVRVFDGSGASPSPARCSSRATGSPRVGAGRPRPSRLGRHGRRWRRRHADAGHGRGAYTLLVERPAGAQRHPADADRGAHPLVRAHRQALSRHGLDVLPGRRHGQAAARRRRSATRSSPARSRARATWRRARRSRCPAGSATRPCRICRIRSSASAPSSTGPRKCGRRVRMFLKYGVDTIKLNLSGEYIAGLPAEFTPMTDEEIAVAVKEVRVRGKRSGRPCALRRGGQAVRAPRHRDHLPRELRRRGGARHARGGEGPALRGARASPG